MSLYQAKHKARGRYGVIDSQAHWLADFLGDKEEARAKANQLNQSSPPKASKTHTLVATNNRRLQQFRLTAEGWLFKGE